MANPILSKLLTSPGDPPTNGSGNSHDREGFLVESLKLIRKVIAGRRSVTQDDAADISQDAAFRLWKWHTKYPDKSSQMEKDEWSSFTARTAHNEVNRTLFKNRSKKSEVPFDEIDSIGDVQSTDLQSDTFQLVDSAWQGICKLSLYQRQALLFSSIDLVLYLLQYGIEEKDLLRALNITEKNWEKIAERMPLSDEEIAQIAKPGSILRETKTTAGAIKKARFDGRKKLKELMK